MAVRINDFVPITASIPVINEGERHIACVLLVETSSAMSGDPLNVLNKTLMEFGDALRMDPLACGRIDVAVISFNSSVQTEMGFRPASEYEAPTLSASGGSAFNEAILAGLDALEARKAEYRAAGTNCYRPWLFTLSDGAPTDSYLEAAAKKRLQDAIRNKKVVYMPMGIGANADSAKLQSYYPDEAIHRPVLKADTVSFEEAFTWPFTASIVTPGETEICIPPLSITLPL